MKLMNPGEAEKALQFEYDRGSVYEQDSRVSRALDALLPEADLIDANQRTFQILHLNTEYTWYAMHFELRQVIGALERADFDLAVRLMERVGLLADIPLHVVRTLSFTLTQVGMLRMRSKLPAGASGLDSPGMINLRRVAKVVWQTFVNALAQAGQTPEGLAVARAKTNEQPGVAWSALAQVQDRLHQLDCKWLDWKQQHVRLVWTHLGGAKAFLDANDPNAQPAEVDAANKPAIPVSLRGRPVTDLLKLATAPLFPELWALPDAVYRHMADRS
jgi:tryptophan 2,3-dioxygenase